MKNIMQLEMSYEQWVSLTMVVLFITALLISAIVSGIFSFKFAEKPQWKRFDEELPTTAPEGQVNILFCRPKWAAYRRGMYTHKIGEGLSDCLSEYDIDNDKYYAWDGEDRHIPTHWMKSPEIPIK